MQPLQGMSYHQYLATICYQFVSHLSEKVKCMVHYKKSVDCSQTSLNKT
jgi:hypothetical protein